MKIVFPWKLWETVDEKNDTLQMNWFHFNEYSTRHTIYSVQKPSLVRLKYEEKKYGHYESCANLFGHR